MSSTSEYLTQSANFTHEIARHFCPFRFCNKGPLTEAALFEHLSNHYRRALARKLTEFIVRQERSREGQK